MFEYLSEAGSILLEQDGKRNELEKIMKQYGEEASRDIPLD